MTIDEFSVNATKSSNLASQAVLRLIRESVKPNEDWGMTKNRLKFLKDVLCKALVLLPPQNRLMK